MSPDALKANAPAIPGATSPDKPFQHGVLRRLVEGFMFFRAIGEKTFFDAESFPWVSGIEAEWTAVRKELEGHYGAPGRHSELSGHLGSTEGSDRRRTMEDLLALCIW